MNAQIETPDVIPKKPMPKPKSIRSDEVFRMDWRSFPVAMGCEGIKNTDSLRLCLEDKLLNFIKNELVYPTSKINPQRKEKITIQYYLDELQGVSDIVISPDTDPNMKKEIIRVLKYLEKNISSVVPFPSRNRQLLSIRIEHVLEL